MKEVVNKEHCYNQILSSADEMDISSKNITQFKKIDLVTNETLQLKKTQSNDELSDAFSKSTNEVTNTVNFCN